MYNVIDRVPAPTTYTQDEISSIVSSCTSSEVVLRDVDDKQMDDLMSFIFKDVLDQEDSYDY